MNLPKMYTWDDRWLFAPSAFEDYLVDTLKAAGLHRSIDYQIFYDRRKDPDVVNDEVYILFPIEQLVLAKMALV